MNSFDYYIMEEFIFPEEGGVTGTRPVDYPHCQSVWELEVDADNTADGYTCDACGGSFEIDWPAGQVRYNPE